MPDVVGVRFKSCGKIYDFEADGLDLKKGDSVVVESELGLSIGSVVIEERPPSGGTRELKKVLRKAAEEDLRQRIENEKLEAEARAYCLERIMARGLPMKLICTEATLDKKRVIFYFAAEGRIDFRELVKDLAARFKTRIEMRQIGVRDEAKMLGGLGICGRELCCKKFLTTFEPISIKMAKSQELVLNASKLSGVCGRLMCCLSYEYGGDEEEAGRSEDLSSGGEMGEKVPADSAKKPASGGGERRNERAEDSREGAAVGGPGAPHPVIEPVRSEEGAPAKGEHGAVQENPAGPAAETASGQGTGEGEKQFRRRRRRNRRRHRR